MRFRLGISYVTGLNDLADLYEEGCEATVASKLPLASMDLDLDDDRHPGWPTLFPYYQWDFGLLVGPSIGPFMFMYAYTR